MNYDEAKALMAAHDTNVRNGHGCVAKLARDRKKLGFRTFLYKILSPADDIPETYVIRYFDHRIITFKKDWFEITDAGFFSHCTHEHLNEYMPNGFHVHGYTAPWLGEPVGFVNTPLGVWAYNMPMKFTYEGDGHGLSKDAGPAFHAIPAYVRHLLDGLFNGELFWGQEVENATCMDYAAWILQRTANFLILMEAVKFNETTVGNCSLRDWVRYLVGQARGAKVLTKRTAAMRARRIELTLQTGLAPEGSLVALRKSLRLALINHLVWNLNFEEQTWNRREPDQGPR